MIEKDFFWNSDVPTDEQELDFVIDAIKNKRPLPQAREESFVDVKFCCDDGILEFSRFLADLKGSGQAIGEVLLPKSTAFSAVRLSPTFAFLAFRLFRAREVLNEDCLEWKRVLDEAGSDMGRQVVVALGWRVCEEHEIK